MISLDNLTTGYGTVAVSRSLNGTIPAGRLTCLLGPNGAGKSTLLRTIAAFQPPLEGSVRIGGRPVDTWSQTELSHTIGVVLTERIMVTETNVEELVRMGRSPYTGFFGRLTDADRSIADRAIALTGIGELRKRNVSGLSDGERQKALIAKVLAQETPVILLDEPTAFLDYPVR